MTHILAQTTILYKPQRWDDFCHISPAAITRDFLSRFYGFTELAPKLFSESSLSMSHILVKTTILYKRQRWADVCRNYFSEAPLPMSHILEKRQFCTSANGGRISVRFTPTTITMDFRFSNFTALRGFYRDCFF